MRKKEKNQSDKFVTMSTTSSKPAWKIEKQIDDENGQGSVLQFTSKEEARMIVQARLAMKLTQKDLAVKLNMPLVIIQQIESGKSVDNRNHMSRILRFLGIKKP